jgi:hypothetical protein
MATLADVEKLAAGGSARVDRVEVKAKPESCSEQNRNGW